MMRWLVAVVLIVVSGAVAHGQEPLWEVYNDAGMRALNRGFPADAEKLWKSALEIAEKSNLKDGPQIQTLDALASLYRELGKRAEAITLLQKSLDLTEKNSGAESLAVGQRCQKLGEFLMEDAGGDAKAEPYFKRSLAIGGKEPDLQTVAGPGFSLYNCYLSQNKLPEAEHVIRWCLGIAEKKGESGARNPVAPCLHGLATVQIKRKQDAEAEATFREALIRQEKESGPESPAVMWGLFRTGDFYATMLGRPAQAEPFYRRALAIAELQGDGGIGKRAECALMLADICQALQKDKEARAFQERCVTLCNKFPTLITEADKRNFALMLLKVARVSIYLNNFAEAEVLCKRAQALMESVPSGRLDIGAAYRGLADCYLGQNKIAEGEGFATKALAADEARFGKAHGYVALDLSRLAHVARLKNIDAEADRLSQQSVKIGEMEIGIYRPDVREVFDEYRALLQKKNKMEAINQLEARAAALHLPPSRGTIK